MRRLCVEGSVSDCGLRTLLTILREVVRLDMVGNVGAVGMSVAALGLEAFERSGRGSAWKRKIN
ncbi:MAG: hypothetical protein IKW86_03255 [Salinivirgaceae bacterium]|nr:hypothetical protein [Salinivirgaceae bacterium]